MHDVEVVAQQRLRWMLGKEIVRSDACNICVDVPDFRMLRQIGSTLDLGALRRTIADKKRAVLKIVRRRVFFDGERARAKRFVKARQKEDWTNKNRAPAWSQVIP